MNNFSLFSASSPASTVICFTNLGHSDKGKMKSRSSLNLLSVASVTSLAETLLLLLFLKEQHCQVLLPTQDGAGPVTEALVASVCPDNCF